MRRRVIVGLAAIAALAASACTTYLNRPFRTGDRWFEVAPDSSYELAYVEFDELGWYWDRAQARNALALVDRRARETNTIVLVFAHGWHHNAKVDDPNVVDFKQSLARLKAELNTDFYRAARQQLTRDPNVRVVGVYLGWRGRSAPGFLDFFTFWGRKSGAERVGDADLRGFVVQLDQLYRSYNGYPPSATARVAPPGGRDPFLGLVFVGHSFGGQALLEATSELLHAQLAEQASAVGRASATQASRGALVPGVGDLVLLVNPASEAAAYNPTRELARDLRFSDVQTPALVVVSSEDDFPRRVLFPIGRTLGALFPARRDAEQRRADRRALGMYAPQLSHDLQWHRRPDATSSMSLERLMAAGPLSGATAAETGPSCPEVSDGNGPSPAPAGGDTWGAEHFASSEAARRVDFVTCRQWIGGTSVMPRAGHPDVRPYHPIVVATAKPGLIEGHSGIFTSQFQLFLTRYVAYVEAKRLVTRPPRRVQLQESAAAR